MICKLFSRSCNIPSGFVPPVKAHKNAVYRLSNAATRHGQLQAACGLEMSSTTLKRKSTVQHLLSRLELSSTACTLPSFCGVKTQASDCIVTVSMWKFKDWASCFQVPDFNNLQTTRQNKTISINNLRLCPAMKRHTPGRKCSRSAHRVSLS